MTQAREMAAGTSSGGAEGDERSVNHLVAETLTRDGRIAPQARTRACSGVKRTGIRLMPLMKFERNRSTCPVT